MGDLLFAIVAVVVGIIAMVTMVRYPAIPYALFLSAGLVKADARFQLPGGIDLTAALLVLALGIVFFRLLTVDSLQIPRPPLFLVICYLGFAALVVFGYLRTPSPIYGLDKMLRFLVFVTAAAFLPLFILRKRSDFTALFLTFVGIATMTSIEILRIGQFGSLYNASAFGAVYLMVGRFTGLGLVLVIVYFLTARYDSPRAWLWALFWMGNAAIIAVSLIAAAGRGPILAVVVAVFVAVLLSMRARLPHVFVRNRAIFAVCFALILGGIALIVVNPGEVATRSIIRLTSLVGGADKSAADRTRMYDYAIEAISQYPILGLGTGGFSMFAENIDARIYAHNMFLEIGAELGLVGLAFFGALLLGAMVELVNGLRSARDYDTKRILITVGAIFWLFFANAMVTGDMTDNRVVFAAVGLCVAARSLTKRESADQLFEAKKGLIQVPA